MMAPAAAQGVAAMRRLEGHAFRYEDCDIPAEMTIREFRVLRSGGGTRLDRIALLGRLRSRPRADTAQARSH
jgi:hypothetical protein